MKNSLLVVNYHYIREVFPESGIKGITPKEFKLQIETIYKEKFKFIGLTELHDIILNDKKSLREEKLCLITFDDGLAESFFYGFDFLVRKGIPCAFYVCSQTVGRREVLDVHKLHLINSKMKVVDVDKFISTPGWKNFRELNSNVISRQYPWDELETACLKYFFNFYLDLDSKTRIIRELFDSTGIDEVEYSRELYISDSDIIKLSRLNSLGSHGKKHLALTKLSNDHQEFELSESKTVLEKLTGAVIDSFSYPYGGETAVNNSLFEKARNAGYKSGFTMMRGLNSENDLRLNPLAIKRYDTNEVFGGKSEIIFRGDANE